MNKILTLAGAALLLAFILTQDTSNSRADGFIGGGGSSSGGISWATASNLVTQVNASTGVVTNNQSAVMLGNGLLITNTSGNTATFYMGGSSMTGGTLQYIFTLPYDGGFIFNTSIGNAANIYAVVFTGSGSGLTNVPAASLTGTVPLGVENPSVITNTQSAATLGANFALQSASPGGYSLSLKNTFGGQNSTNVVLSQVGNILFQDYLGNSLSTTLSNVTATTFTGSGSGLTSIPAGQLTGIAPTNTVPPLLPSSITGNAATASLATNLVSGASLTNVTFTGTPPTYFGNALLTNAPSTNGFVTANVTNGLATTGFALAIGANDTNYVNASTNGLIPLAAANLSATNAAKNATNTLPAPALVGLVPAAALPTGTVTNALSFSRMPYAYQARLAQARSKRFGLAFIGDSFTWGVGATQDAVLSYSNCYPELVFSSLPASYQAGRWLQAFPNQATTNGVTILSGAGANANNGWQYVSVSSWQVMYMNYPAVVSSNCSFSVTGYGTNAQLWLYGNNSPTNNHLYCVVDGGGTTNTISITNNFSNAGSGRYAPYNVNLGAAGYHTVVCTVSNNQYVQFAGALLSWQTNGVILYNFGWPGHSLAVNDWQSPLTNFAPDMVFVCSGLNEWNTGLNTNTFATNVTSVVTNTLFVGGLPILMSEPSAWNTDTTNGKVLYNMQTLAVANNYNAPAVDWWSLWSPIEATNTALGLLNSAAASHPSNAGFISIGSFIFRQLIEPYITRDR
jgi:hypothetical protein